MKFDKIIAGVSAYYTEKLDRFGETPQGVDWNSTEAQEVRFTQILSVCRDDPDFSLNDIGCGYGALVDHCDGLAGFRSYYGFDVADNMIAAAKKRYDGRDNVHFTGLIDTLPISDYTVASGIFSVKRDVGSEEWREYVLDTIGMMREHSRRGFAFNCLTSASDPEKMRPDLYYADAHELFEYCRTKFSRNVALLHDYGIYEFTLRVGLL